MSVLLSSIGAIEDLVKNHDLETRVRLCERSSIGLIVYNSIPYVSLQYETGKGKNPFYFNIKQQEFIAFIDILKQVKMERDRKLKSLKESLDDRKSAPAPHQTTVYEVHFKHPDSEEQQSQIFFNLEEGIQEITNDGFSIVASERRRVEIPSLPSIALMFATLLKRCKRDGLVETLDHVTLAKYVESYFSMITPNPYVSSEILTVSKIVLASQHPVDEAFVHGDMINAVLNQFNPNIPHNFIPKVPSGWQSKLGIGPNICITN